MTNTHIKLLEIAQEGRLAEALKLHFGPVVKERIQSELNKMKSSFRGGKVDSVTLSSHLAALCALEDLERDLDQKIKRAQQSTKGILENEPS